jgi:hypothetical protein
MISLMMIVACGQAYCLINWQGIELDQAYSLQQSKNFWKK